MHGIMLGMRYQSDKDYNNQKRGFTLIELLIVLSLIVILSGGILTAIYNARKESRDMARATTAEQLKLAIRLYKDAKGAYPSATAGTELVPATGIGAEILPYIKGFTEDTMRASGHEYWYDSDFDCTVAGQKVIFMRKLEFPENSNFDAVCGAGNPSNLPGSWTRTEVFVTVIN